MPFPSAVQTGLGLLALFATLLPAVAWPQTTVPVTTAMPLNATVSETLNLTGSLTAERQARLSPRTDGLVAEVLVDAGDHVETGEVLLRLDPALASHEHSRARATTAEARAARDEAARLVEEARRLRQQNHISASELANRESALALAEAALLAAQATESTAREQLQRHELTAPFGGVISAKLTEAGEWVNRGDAVLELVGLDRVRLEVKAPQERFADIRADTRVEVIPDAFPGTSLDGRVTALVPVSDAQARAFLVRVHVDAGALALLPGTSATARFVIGGEREKLLVPRDALLRHPDGGYSLFVVIDGVAQRRQVSIGRQGPDGIAVLSGLSAGEAVVIRGNEVLRDGQAVHIVNTER